MKLKWDFIIRLIMLVLGNVLAEKEKEEKKTAKAEKKEVINV